MSIFIIIITLVVIIKYNQTTKRMTIIGQGMIIKVMMLIMSMMNTVIVTINARF